MDGAKNCTAAFTLVQETLTVVTAGEGSGTVTSDPPGILDCDAECSQTWDHGIVVTLTATPDADSLFGGWSGDPDCSDGIVTMMTARSCVATFVPRPAETQSVFLPFVSAP